MHPDRLTRLEVVLRDLAGQLDPGVAEALELLKQEAEAAEDR
jgi:hypothetical protein